MSSNNSFKNEITYKVFAYKSPPPHIYIYVCVCVCVCELDLVLNNPERLICHKTPTNHLTISL